MNDAEEQERMHDAVTMKHQGADASVCIKNNAANTH